MKNKYLIFVFVVLLFIVGISFYQYYDEYFSYADDYYLIKDNCYNGKNPNHKVCDMFNKNDPENIEKHFNWYIKQFDPIKQYKELDAITLTSNIVELTYFDVLQYLSPLLIIMIVVGKFHTEYSHGMFKNYLLRSSYKDYWKKNIKYILKISLITPILLCIVFAISCLVTNFNFEITEQVKEYAVYNDFKYHHYFIYGFIVCLIQYIVNIIYSCLGLIACKHNKSKVVSILLAYISFVVINLFMYLFVYEALNFVFSHFLGITLIWESFILNGYWFFDYGIYNGLTQLLVASIILSVSGIITYLIYKNKEEVIMAYEKQDA